MKPSEILSKAADLIEPPNTWGQIHFAVNKKGRPVEISACEACRWCAVGAVIRSATQDVVKDFDAEISDMDNDTYHALIAMRMAVVTQCWPHTKIAIGGQQMLLWNDAAERTQREVVAALRKAAELAQQSEANQ